MRQLSKANMVKTVTWRDLTGMRKRDGVIECLHPLPWLTASLTLAHFGQFIAALPCTFMFFLTGLRLNHEAIHSNLGFNAMGHRGVLHVLSMIMLCSNHSVAWNHLRHHRHAGQDCDLEGKAGRMTFLQVIFYGPVFAWETHTHAWHDGGQVGRRRMMVDGGLNLVFPVLAIMMSSQALFYHLVLMATAQCLTAFFAVWITHHGCDDHVLVARTQRNKWINMLSYNMFFHFEHHTFPGVPVKRLGILAQRLDRAFPEISGRIGQVIPKLV